MSNEMVFNKFDKNKITSMPFLDEENYKYIPLLNFSSLNDFLQWKTINSTININKLIMIKPNISIRGKLFALYAPFFTPYFNKNSILVISTNLNNENKNLNLFIGYSDKYNSYYIIKKENGEFFAYIEQPNNTKLLLKLTLVAIITNVILDSNK